MKQCRLDRRKFSSESFSLLSAKSRNQTHDFACCVWLALTLEEKCILRVFGSRVVRRVYVQGYWGNLRNKELHDFYSSSFIVSMVNRTSGAS